MSNLINVGDSVLVQSAGGVARSIPFSEVADEVLDFFGPWEAGVEEFGDKADTINLIFTDSAHNTIHSNAGATTIISHTLWDPVPLTWITFRRVANYALRLIPPAGVTIGEGGSGKYLELLTRGAVRLKCNIAHQWEVDSSSCMYEFEV